jgi:hypothetical protein
LRINKMLKSGASTAVAPRIDAGLLGLEAGTVKCPLEPKPPYGKFFLRLATYRDHRDRRGNMHTHTHAHTCNEYRRGH